EAAVGAAPEAKPTKGFDSVEIAAFLRRNATQLQQAKLPEREGLSAAAVALQASQTLADLAQATESKRALSLEGLERRLTVLEEKLFAVLLAVIPDEEVISVRTQADRELTVYRAKIPASQIEQLRKQFVHKRLLEKYGVPRLSLFYM